MGKGRKDKVSEQTFVRRVVSQGIAIEAGTTLRLTGLRDRGEMAAVDYIELVPIDPTVPLPFRVEAEEMELSHFTPTPLDGSSSGHVISLKKQEGSAQFAFPKDTGLYFNGPK